jgi:hypothetical protein
MIPTKISPVESQNFHSRSHFEYSSLGVAKPEQATCDDKLRDGLPENVHFFTNLWMQKYKKNTKNTKK